MKTITPLDDIILYLPLGTPVDFLSRGMFYQKTEKEKKGANMYWVCTVYQMLF